MGKNVIPANGVKEPQKLISKLAHFKMSLQERLTMHRVELIDARGAKDQRPGGEEHVPVMDWRS